MSNNTNKSEKDPLLECEKLTGESDNSCLTTCCHSKSVTHRYILLVFLCLIGVGDYFCVDNPAALQEHILEDIGISETKYMGFYSSLQWTGIVSCLLGGFLLDKAIGNRLGLIIFSSLLTISHGLFAMGALLNSYFLMYVARAIYGVMEGPLAIANDNLTVKWFKSKELNMVFGLKTSLARMGSVLNMNVMGPIYSYVGMYFTGYTCLGVTLFTGVGVCLISTLSACITAVIDKRADTILHHSDGSPHQSKNIKLSDVRRFPVTYWLIALTTTMYYLALFPFVGLGMVYFEMKYNYDPPLAGNVNGLVYLIAAVTMPVFGLCIDKTGKNLIWMFFGITISLGGHALLAFTFVNPYVATAMLGTGYSVFTATVWPLVAYVVNQQHLGTAYGIMNAVISVGQGAITYLAGYLVDTRGYLVLEVFFVACICAALILGALLYIADSITGGYLNLTRVERSSYRETYTRSNPQPEESQIINTSENDDKRNEIENSVDSNIKEKEE